ncbi:MAG: nagA [Rhodospirillales bacterium]|jgi:N-acetylglucosamine-6-phosphate deacetylase|nr:nagA [Rhodospirillales bacterium]
MRQTLTGARIFTGESTLDDHALVLEDERIVDLVPARDAPNLPPGSILAAGFVDTQVNGGGGVLFNATPTAASIRTIQAAHRRFGTTTLLPTLITDTETKMQEAVAAAREAGTGIHLEGPFISRERRGVHEARYVRPPTADDIAFLCALPAILPRVLVSLAPETVAPEDVARLVQAGLVVAGAHSAASYERTREALARGMTGFTHLFNAMPPLANRAPGIAGAALDDASSWCGVIVDGVHVHPAMLKLALAAKPRGKLFLVTDSMPPLGTELTRFELYGQTIHRRDGRLVTDDGTLAGADLDMAQAVRNAVSMLGVGLDEALRMASLYPAQFIGLADRGRIAPGLRADLVLLDETLHVHATWIGGQSD